MTPDLQLADDLRWLQANAFDCHVTMNGHRAGFESVTDHLASYGVDDEDWTDLDAKATAIETNSYVEVQVYPNGSVSSYSIYGIELGRVVARARELCEAEQQRWRNNGMLPMHQRPDP